MATNLTDRRSGSSDLGHQRKFTVGFVILGIILAAAVALTLVLAEQKPPPWTKHPIAKIEDPVERAQAVATVVQGRYLADDGKPLATVSAGEDVVSDLPGRDQVIALASTPSGPPFSFEYGNIVFFGLCATGKDCAVDESAKGKPLQTVALLSRAAKELALRGLKSVPEAQFAIVVMPNGILQPATPGGKFPTVVYFYRRTDLHQALKNALPAEYDGPEPTPAQVTPTIAGNMFNNYAKSMFAMVQKSSPDNGQAIYELTPPPPR